VGLLDTACHTYYNKNRMVEAGYYIAIPEGPAVLVYYYWMNTEDRLSQIRRKLKEIMRREFMQQGEGSFNNMIKYEERIGRWFPCHEKSIREIIYSGQRPDIV